jgi:hypothetical protein
MRNRTIFSVVIVILLLMGIEMASARLPASGDHVKIYNSNELCYEGTITEIGNGFVDLMSDKVLEGLPERKKFWRNIGCIGSSKRHLYRHRRDHPSGVDLKLI